MHRKALIHSFMTLVYLVSILFSGWQPASAQPAAKSLSLKGWFTIIWGDGPAGSAPIEPVYLLSVESGRSYRLTLDEKLAAAQGGVLSLDRKYVSVRGIEATPDSQGDGQAHIQVESIEPVSSPDKPQTENAGNAVSGSQPFVSIMCKFADVATEPKNQAYFLDMYGSTYPRLDHYWREVSYNMANIVRSNAVGWYVLPQPRSYYIYNNALDFDRAADDCTGVADANVNFANFVGINLMFNAELDGYAWGGAHYMTLDGVAKVWPMTWEPPWGYEDITVMSHEMGHAFGLPHSSGNYGQVYDNRWDVLSDTWTDCARSTHATFGCLGQHTISYHKDKLGWIPTAQKFIALQNTNATITLEQLALPTNNNYKMIQIPINGSFTHFYTVEVRRQTGYDIKLPGQAVIIHEVDTTRAEPAHVIDTDGNGNTGDAGAMWTVGETFTDSAIGLTVSMLSATATGFQVQILCDCAQTSPPAPPANFRVSNATPFSVTLAWDDAYFETGYKIYKWDGVSAFVYYDSVGPNVTSYVYTRASCDWTEFYEVSAYNDFGESAHAGWIQGDSLPCPPAPSANFTASPLNGPAPLATTFHITDLAGIDTCSWTYGDGQTSTACTQDHDHTYQNPGIYTVSLSVNGYSGSDSLTRTNYISASIPCFTLATNSNPLAGGTVNANPAPNCAGDPTKYTQNTVVTLTASHNTWYVFNSWGGDASGTTNPATVTMTANKSVTANFIKCFGLAVMVASGNGTVDADPAPNCVGSTDPDQIEYIEGTVVTLTALPSAGYAFGSWGGNFTDSNNPLQVTMTGDYVVLANFTQTCFTLSTNSSPAGGGSVTPNPAPNCPGDSTKYSTGTTVTLTAAPNAGHTFSSWGGDASGTVNPATVTMSADRSVTANFNPTCHSLMTSANPLGGGTVGVSPAPNCNGNQYTWGTLVTLTANPNLGFNFTAWGDDASGTANPTTITITDDHSVTADFDEACYTLTTGANPVEGGSVEVSPEPDCSNGTQYTWGAIVTLTANPNSGYNFASWGGDASGTENPTTVTMEADRSVAANFNQIQACYTLTTGSNPVAGGNVDASPAPNCNGTQYTSGTIVTLTAIPNPGYNFTSWSGDASGATSPTTVTMSADRSVTADFSQSQDCYTLITEINIFGGGAVNASPAPNCSTSPTKYATGTQVTLTAVPSAGFAFGNWSGDASGTDNPTTVVITVDKTVTANFEANCFMLFASPNPAEGGSIEASPAPNCAAIPGKYARDTIVTLTATANAGYNFLAWSGDASGTANPTTVTINADKFVTADFSQTCYTLTVDSNPLMGGSVNANPAPDCAGNPTKYAMDTVVTLTASPGAGYGFSNWSGDVSGITNPATVTMSADKSVTANFVQTCFSLTVGANPVSGGSIGANPSPNCPGDATKYSTGTTVTLTATANSGYSFSSWSGDASGADNPTTVTMSANRTVTANFATACYALTTNASPGAGGSVAADPAPNCATDSTKYTAGTAVTLTATANTGYSFSSWSGAASGTDNPITINMTADKSVTANFTAVCYTLTKSANPAAGGSISVNPAPNCAGDPTKYTAGTSVNLTATPSAGYAFASWSGSASGTNNTTTISMSADKSVTANFTPSCFTLTKTANPAAAGSVSASPAPNCTGVPTKYTAGTQVTLTATASTGFVFSAWSGSASGTTNPTTVTMSADKSVTANFTAACYTLTKAANPTAGGTISASPAPNCNSTQYTYGSVVTLTAHPSANYVFTSWSGHASGSTNPINLTMTANKSVTANFVSNSTPVVTSIVRADASPTSSVRVKYTVTFSEPVTGVDTHDFALTTYGLQETFVGNVTGEAQTYTVTVNTGTGNGTLRLDLVDNDTIKDSTGVPLGGTGAGNGSYTGGQSYTVVKGATYEDVPIGYWAWQYVERLHNAGVTSGCWENPPYFCPTITVNRAQMAVFLLRARYGATYSPPAPTGAVFPDVPKTYWAAAWIEQVYREGWTSGCGNGKYCPQTVVTRGQMAVFLLRAKHGATYNPPAATGLFSDVPKSYWAAAWIEQLYREGVTGGCGGENYCPASPVTRAQMAVFLVKAFNLP
jgi:M6 family metalloprotease-like protein